MADPKKCESTPSTKMIYGKVVYYLKRTNSRKQYNTGKQKTHLYLIV